MSDDAENGSLPQPCGSLQSPGGGSNACLKWAGERLEEGLETKNRNLKFCGREENEN